MAQPETAQQPIERRTKNFSEVSLGFNKTLAQNEARRCPQCAQPTCTQGCPLGIDIPGFIRLLREGDAVGSLAKIKEQNPLPGVCGRVCLAPCEPACVLNDEGAIAIRALERFAADNGRQKFSARNVPSPNGKKVGVIGSGPSGLAAAYGLAQRGYAVTIFEAMAQPGGILRYGIPEFRLPSKVLEAEIADIQALGVVFKTNVLVGEMLAFEELRSAFDAVLLATGADTPQSGGPGDHLIGVFFAQEFLSRVNLFNAPNFPKSPTPALIGNTVAVIGSGYAAFDCARAAVRLGKKASIVFSGLEEEIEVYPQERKDAVAEGVKLESLTSPLEIVAGDNQKVIGLRCERLDFSHDEAGRWQVKTVPGSEFILEAETVIMAGPGKPSGVFERYLPDLVLNPDGTVRINELTGLTSMKNVFATGNVTTGGGTVVDAMASGKRAANAIHQYLHR